MILVPIDLADALETVGLITKSESGSRYLGKEIMAEWHEDHSNLVAVANMLYDEGADSQELLNFFEKPWNYSEAWDNYNAKRESEGDANVNT